MFNIMASFAKWERDMTAERTSAGMAAAKRAGKIMSGLSAITPRIWFAAHKVTTGLKST